jgi:C1A family cysteine protease
MMDDAFSWINKNGGLCSEESYPYISQDGEVEKCETTCDLVPKSQIQSWVNVASNDNALMTAIAQQPVSVAIEADQIDFQLYKSGVLTGTCGTTLDHGVLVVGYGTENGEDYYLVKNSWGTSWGDEGYIKLGRGPQYIDGQCGILLEASYPVLYSSYILFPTHPDIAPLFL